MRTLSPASLLLLFLLLPLLAGCEALVIGGAAGAAGYIANDERTVGEITDDATITARVKRKLFADDEISALAIDVDTHRGTVTLTGTVPNEAALARALELARVTRGVVAVEHALTVDPAAD